MISDSLEEDKMRISEALINLSDKALQVIELGKKK